PSTHRSATNGLFRHRPTSRSSGRRGETASAAYCASAASAAPQLSSCATFTATSCPSRSRACQTSALAPRPMRRSPLNPANSNRPSTVAATGESQGVTPVVSTQVADSLALKRVGLPRVAPIHRVAPKAAIELVHRDPRRTRRLGSAAVHLRRPLLQRRLI